MALYRIEYYEKHCLTDKFITTFHSVKIPGGQPAPRVQRREAGVLPAAGGALHQRVQRAGAKPGEVHDQVDTKQMQ